MGLFGSLFGGGATPGVTKVDGAKARELVGAGATLLDVRSPAEFSGGALPGAVNIPVQVIGARLGELDKSKPVVVYCAAGARSASAASSLAGAGFEQVYDLGGMGRW